MAKIGVVTPQNIGGILKRINERIADIGRRASEGLGMNSELYERYEKAINRMLPSGMRGQTKQGFVKIVNNKETRQLLSKDYVNELLKIGNYETRGSYRTRKKKMYLEQFGKDPSDEELTAELKARQKYKEAYGNGKITDKYNELTKSELDILHKKRNSWAEINAIMSRLFGERQKKVHRSKTRTHYESARERDERIKLRRNKLE